MREVLRDAVLLHSGALIPFTRFDSHLHDVQPLDPMRIARLIYIFDNNHRTLTSCSDHLNISVRDAPTRSHLLGHQKSIQLTVNDIPRNSVDLSELRFDHTGSVSFLHETRSNRLLAILAPHFHLVRIMEWNTHVILIDTTHRTGNSQNDLNHGPLNLMSHMQQQISSQSRIGSMPASVRQTHWPKCVPRKMEIQVLWDQSFCAQFENNSTYAAFQILGAIAKVIPVFELRTCVSITIAKFVGYCRGGKLDSDPLERMPTLDTCFEKSNCQRPSIILQTVRNFWWSRNETLNTPDAVLFLSGYDDGTSVVGAAYVGGACTTYRFGWAEKLRHQVVAHEIGHLLGAQHGKYGLMRGIIDTTKPSTLSKRSAAEIWEFVQNPKTGWCLSRDSTRNHQRTIFQDIGIPRSRDLEPESVFVFDSRIFVGIKFLVLARNKTDPFAPLAYLRIEGHSLSGRNLTNETKTWNNTRYFYGPYEIPIDRKWQLESAAITMSRYNLPVILTVRKSGSRIMAHYVVAKGTRHKPTPNGWLPPRFVPVGFNTGTIQSCSITRSRKDFIIAFAKKLGPRHVSLFFTIGRSISWKGFATRGWTGLRTVPVAINGTVTAMSVTALDFLKDGVVDLAFSYISFDSTGKSRMKIIVGFAVSENGNPEGGWSQEVEFAPPPERQLTRTSVGHAILVTPRGFVDSDTGRNGVFGLPSVGFIDTVAEEDVYRLVLQHEALSNGILYEASIVENGEAIPACEKCYTKMKSDSCVRLRLECSEAKGRLSVLETGVLKSRLSSMSSRSSFGLQEEGIPESLALSRVDDSENLSDPGYPDQVGADELYCAGVYKLFIAKTGGSCAGKVSDAWIVTAGLAHKIQDNLYDRLVIGQSNSTWAKSDVTVIFSVNGTSSDDSLSGAFTDVKNKGPSQIQIFSKKWLRAPTVYRAVKRSLSATDYGHWFGNQKQPILRRSIVRRGNYKFVVILNFPWKSVL